MSNGTNNGKVLAYFVRDSATNFQGFVTGNTPEDIFHTLAKHGDPYDVRLMPITGGGALVAWDPKADGSAEPHVAVSLSFASTGEFPLSRRDGWVTFARLFGAFDRHTGSCAGGIGCGTAQVPPPAPAPVAPAPQPQPIINLNINVPVNVHPAGGPLPAPPIGHAPPGHAPIRGMPPQREALGYDGYGYAHEPVPAAPAPTIGLVQRIAPSRTGNLWAAPDLPANPWLDDDVPPADDDDDGGCMDDMDGIDDGVWDGLMMDGHPLPQYLPDGPLPAPRQIAAPGAAPVTATPAATPTAPANKADAAPPTPSAPAAIPEPAPKAAPTPETATPTPETAPEPTPAPAPKPEPGPTLTDPPAQAHPAPPEAEPEAETAATPPDAAQPAAQPSAPPVAPPHPAPPAPTPAPQKQPAAQPAKPAPTPATADTEGHHFLRWLVDGLKLDRHAVNTNTAFVHTVPDGLLIVSPMAFRAFYNAHNRGSNKANWEHLLNQFLALKLHKPAPDGGGLWTYGQPISKDNIAKISSILIENPLAKLGLDRLPAPNPALTLRGDQPNQPKQHRH